MKKRIQEPLRFERVFLEKVWGGRTLGAAPEDGGLRLALPDGIQVGETWELVDREDVNSVVASGSFAGARLEELMAEADAQQGPVTLGDGVGQLPVSLPGPRQGEVSRRAAQNYVR